MWSSSASQAFENDPTLKDILAATYTSSRRSNYAIVNGTDKSIMTIWEELLDQGFNLLLIGNNNDTLEQVKEELMDHIVPDNDQEEAAHLTIEHICILSDDWTKPDTKKSIENTINDLDFPCLLINNYRFYNKNAPTSMPSISPMGITGISSPSFMLYQSMMKSVPLHIVEEVVSRNFYSMQKARGIDLADNTDVSKYQALDSLVLNKTNSAKKRSMKKMAILNIKEYVDQSNLDKKTVSEQKFIEKHHEFWRTDDGDSDEEKEDAQKKPKESDDDHRTVVEEYTVQEEKLWDWYQMFWKLINYKYNPYEDQDLEDYLAMLELQTEENLEMGATKEGKGIMNSIWPFSNQ